MKVPVGTLDSIEKSAGDHSDKLREMLKVWLKQLQPKATWVALISALKSPVIDEARLAETLTKKHCVTGKLWYAAAKIYSHILASIS